METKEKIIEERDAQWRKAIWPNGDGTSYIEKKCGTPETYAGLHQAEVDTRREDYEYMGKLRRKVSKWKRRAAKALKKVARLEGLELNNLDQCKQIGDLDGKLTSALTVQAELEQKLQEAEMERDRFARTITRATEDKVAAERQHNELKQRTMTAIAEFEKLTALIETECKSLGIEWHGSAETTLKAVIGKLRGTTAEDQSTWEIVEHNGKRYRKEPLMRPLNKGEKFLSFGKVWVASSDYPRAYRHILHEITDEVPQAVSEPDGQYVVQHIRTTGPFAWKIGAENCNLGNAMAIFQTCSEASRVSSYLNHASPEHQELAKLRGEVEQIKSSVADLISFGNGTSGTLEGDLQIMRSFVAEAKTWSEQVTQLRGEVERMKAENDKSASLIRALRLGVSRLKFQRNSWRDTMRLTAFAIKCDVSDRDSPRDVSQKILIRYAMVGDDEDQECEPAPAEASEGSKKKCCTCTGTCRGKEGLGDRWYCAMDPDAPPLDTCKLPASTAPAAESGKEHEEVDDGDDPHWEPECANCGCCVHVEDGREFLKGDWCYACLGAHHREILAERDSLRSQLSALKEPEADQFRKETP